jgi:DNA-binding response OmpR family regulator
MKKKQPILLLVEGNRASNNSFAPALRKADYRVEVFHSGNAVLTWAEASAPSLIVFDATAMRSSGARTCRRLRGLLTHTPIIHCRADFEERQPEAGADVYLRMPFTARKLLNRVHDLLPADPEVDEIIRYGHLRLSLGKRAIDVGGQGDQRLTPKLAQLLEELLRHPNEVLSRRDIMRRVWNTDYVGDTRTLDVHVRWVREYIEKDPARPTILRTVRGQGFLLAVPEQVNGTNSHS